MVGCSGGGELLLHSRRARRGLRCTTNGNVTYRDAPCDRPSVPPVLQQAPPQTAVPTVPAAGKPDFYGGWSGQAQYQAKINSRPIDEAHAVVDLVLIINPKGKLTGASRENDCNALGFATPGLGPTLNLDVTLTGCRYSGFNRRFTGTFGLPPGREYAKVSLLAYEARPGVPPGCTRSKPRCGGDRAAALCPTMDRRRVRRSADTTTTSLGRSSTQ